MATHDFYDESTVMGLRGGVKSVDSLDSNVDCSIKSKCVIGVVEIVVDSFRYADNFYTQSIKFGCNAKSIFATNCNESINIHLGKILFDALDAIFNLKWIGAR